MGDPIGQDSRFSKLGTDKKFRKVGRKHKKVKIDSRFQSLFTQEKFVSKCSVDKRGRPRHLSAKEDYEKFYDLDSSDEEEEEIKEETKLLKKKTKEKQESTDDSDSDEEDHDDVEEEEEEEEEDQEGDIAEDEGPCGDLGAEIVSKLRDSEVDYARGEGRLYSSDSSSGEDDTSDEDEDAREEAEAGVFDKWGEMDREAERTEEATERLAVCNMDWDRVGASDIFLALSSFCPSSGCVKSVQIFLSDFGRERLGEEKELGPAELRGRAAEDDDDDEDDEDEDILPNPKKAKLAEAAAMARVRQYQVNRLKYYYAVVEFDSTDTANSVYTECDGMEYELSATRFDLRFIPEDMEFAAPPTETCLTAPDSSKYQPKIFQTSALQQQKVELTWDETDPAREKAMKRAFEAEAEDEMEKVGRELIASASEDEEEEKEIGSGSDEEGTINDKDMISKYRSLLAGIRGKEEKQEDQGNMEVTWKDAEHSEEEDEQEELEKEEMGPWQKYLQKKKDKKKNRKNAKKVAEDALVSDDEIPDGVDMNDPFFAEEFGNEFKKEKVKTTKKQKKRKHVDDDVEGMEMPENKALDLLVMDSDDEKKHFNFKDIVENETNPNKIKKKWKKKKKEIIQPVEDNFSVNVSDDRFGALFSRPEFNIDPTESSFKKTKNMEKIIGEKLKRIQESSSVPDKSLEAGSQLKKPKLEAEVSQSLKTVKNKWKQNAKKNRTKKV